MKVTVAEGFQVVDKDGKAHSSGTIEMDDSDAQQALAAGWVTKPKPSSPSKKSTPKK